MLLHPRNTFLCFWSNRELREWLKEAKYREKNKDIWKTVFPSSRMIREELKRRRKK